MKLNDLMKHSLKDILDTTDVVSIKPLSDEKGNVVKIIVEYVPLDVKEGLVR